MLAIIDGLEEELDLAGSGDALTSRGNQEPAAPRDTAEFSRQRHVRDRTTRFYSLPGLRRAATVPEGECLTSSICRSTSARTSGSSTASFCANSYQCSAWAV